MRFPTYLSVFDCPSLPDLALSASWVLQAKTCTTYCISKINQPLTKHIKNIKLQYCFSHKSHQGRWKKALLSAIQNINQAISTTKMTKLLLAT